MKAGQHDVRVGIAGLGAVGRAIAERLDTGLRGYRLTAVAARRRERAQEYVDGLQGSPEVVPVEALAELADLVVECAPAAIFRAVATPVLGQGKRLVVLSVGALLDAWDLADLAAERRGEILVPTGALVGLDAVQAAAQGEITSVRMVTRKPVAGLLDAPHVQERGIPLDEIDRPVKLFEGSARQAAAGFPANLNVAVALSLAGVGPDRTYLEVWADPALKRNTHTVEVQSDAASLRLAIENVPSENPRTGRITALSVIALLEKLTSPVKIGT
jgi:aspartate dehydrogenase